MALTFNLPSQIVVQTAAQWAADNTVYSAKRILVTSDASWDNTDQRKFKIADGTQTWSQLDYPPIGYETMTTSAGEFKFAKTIAGAVLLWTNGQDMRFSASVGGSPAFILKTDGTIVLENGTANKFLKTGASKEITFVDSPVDVNTIGSAINGATSATPNDTDLVMSVDTSVAKKNTWTQIKAFLKTYFDTVYVGTSDSRLTDTRINRAIFKQNTTLSHTGDTTNTLKYSSLIPAGTFEANDVLKWNAKIGATSNGNTKTIRYYFNTSASLSGATLVATYALSSGATAIGMARALVFQNSLTSQQIGNPSAAFQSEYSALAAVPSTISIDFTVNQYIIIAIQLANAADTMSIFSVYSETYR